MYRGKHFIVVMCILMLLLNGCASSVGLSETEADIAGLDNSISNQNVDDKEVANSAIEDDALLTEKITINSLKPLSGDLVLSTETSAPEDIDEEHAMELDRAMRAYTPAGSTLLINNAKEFYFYEQMNSNEQNIYDAIMMVAEDPIDTNNIVVYTTEEDVYSDSFIKELYTAIWGALYDHPELFWLYNALETDLKMQSITDSKGKSQLYFSLSKPYAKYESEIKAFNKATEEFLGDIDLKQKDYEVAKDIHDKLISLVTYDYDVANNEMMDLAHTAYGALVQNGRGDKNTAVCDGYSLAYLYLLQQAGIPATVILGEGGSNMSDAGGHAWNVIKLGNDWYEVDSTWNDAGNTEVQLDDPLIDEEVAKYYKEALSDKDYREKMDHYMYNITTSDISNYKTSSEYDYYTKDGKYIINLVTDSIHIRDSELNDENYGKWLMKMAPEAKGTAY